MRITPVNNINNQNFGANLQKKDAETLYGAVRNLKDGIPKLYTVLELFNLVQMGEIAELKYLKGINLSVHKPIGYRTEATADNCWQLRIDNKLIEQGSNIYDMIYSAATSGTNITQNEFNLRCKNNSAKTKEDVAALLV